MGCHAGHQESGAGGRKGPPNVFRTIALAIFAAGGIYYLWYQHRAHVLQYLPFVFFLACPLMHLFGGHGGHDHSSRDSKGDSK